MTAMQSPSASRADRPRSWARPQRSLALLTRMLLALVTATGGLAAQRLAPLPEQLQAQVQVQSQPQVPLTANAPGDPTVRAGTWNPRKTPPGWVVVETEHYQVQSEVGEAMGRALGEHLERMLGLYRDFLPFKKSMPTFVLKVFESRAHFKDYSRAGGGAVAYYDKTNRELVSYDTGLVLGKLEMPPAIGLAPNMEAGFSDDDLDQLDVLFDQITRSYTMDLASVLSHEGWHQYFHYYTVSWVPMPSWLDEGLGDYFFAARSHDEEGSYALGALNHGRLRVIQRAFDEGTSVSFGKLLDFEQRDYYSNASVYYAQGWSMVHFLMQHEDKRLQALIPKLIKDFKRSKNFRKSTTKVFKGHDLDELDSAWIGWALRATPEDPLRRLAEQFGQTLGMEDLEGPTYWKLSYLRHQVDLGAVQQPTDEAGEQD
jgi:hypothetical protein